MLKLIRSLTQYKQAEGTLLARADLHLGGKTHTAKTAIISNRGRLTIINAVGCSRSGNPVSSLTLHLMKRTGSSCSVAANKRAVTPSGQLLFSNADINGFLALTGDTNPIHLGAEPVVPGLLILHEILKLFPASDASARFYHSVSANETVYISETSHGVLLFTKDFTAAEIIIKGKNKNE